MERLSDRWMFYCGLLVGMNVSIEDLKHIQDLIDAEEQGLLLRLPCNVGDTVYWICGRQISDVVVYGFRVENNKVFLLDYAGFPFGIMGVDSFLTKEEAEQKLAEMKGE